MYDVALKRLVIHTYGIVYKPLKKRFLHKYYVHRIINYGIACRGHCNHSHSAVVIKGKRHIVLQTRTFTVLINNRYICRLVGMVIHKLVNVDVYYIIAIGKKYVLLGGACYKAHIRLESLDSAAVKALVARRGERRKNKHPLGLAGEVPRLACSEMVHKRLIVALCDNSDLFYAAVYHIGKRKVDKAVSACKRHAAHGAKPRHLAETLVIYV